jgi:hypothetical protein
MHVLLPVRCRSLTGDEVLEQLWDRSPIENLKNLKNLKSSSGSIGRITAPSNRVTGQGVTGMRCMSSTTS